MYLLQLNHLINYIDQCVGKIIDSLLHQTTFQALESQWRNLEKLVKNIQIKKRVLIKLLNHHLTYLLNNSLYTDQFEKTQLFKILNQQYFNQAGAHPFSLLIFDYSLSFHQKSHIKFLHFLSRIGALSFTPILLQADKQLSNLFYCNKSLNADQIDKNLSLFIDKALLSFQMKKDAAYITFVLPHFCIRKPYEKYHKTHIGLVYGEKITTIMDYLWANPCYLLAQALVHSFIKTQWFYHYQNHSITIENPSTLATITPKIQNLLSYHGFTVIKPVYCKKNIRFHEIRTAYRTDKLQQKLILYYLEHLLSICRFAAYLKQLARKKLGNFDHIEALIDYLQCQILKYCSKNPNISRENILKYPLKYAKIQAIKKSSKKNSCQIDLTLGFHYFYSKISTAIQINNLIK